MDSSETPYITEENSVVDMMSSYTALLKKSAELREQTDEDESPLVEEVVEVEQPEPEVVEEEEVEEEIVEEVEEPKPADPLANLFADLEQVFVEGAEVLEPTPEPEPVQEEVVKAEDQPVSKDILEDMFSDFEQLFTAAKPLAKKKPKPTVEQIQTKIELENFFADLESMFTEEPEEEPEEIVEEVVFEEPEAIVEEMVFEPAPVEPEDLDPMSKYTSLLKSSASIREPEQVQEDTQFATVADLNRMTQQLMNNIQKSLSTLGGGGIGELDAIAIARKYGGFGLDSDNAPLDGGGA